jgi:hypothetical protein
VAVEALRRVAKRKMTSEREHVEFVFPI